MLLAENIYKGYKQPVLNGVTLTVSEGEIVGVAGENGSGKSTLLSIITTIIKPARGCVTVEGEDVFRQPGALKRLIGYVPQENSLFDHLSAMDNIKLWASAYDTNWRTVWPTLFPARDEPDNVMLKKKVKYLSGGMKKRLSIALSLMHNPMYLIMDEPSAALDIGFKQRLAEIMHTVKARGQSVLFSTHQPDELLLCDRIYVLRQGHFVFEGDPRQLAATQDFTESLYGLITGRPYAQTNV